MTQRINGQIVSEQDWNSFLSTLGTSERVLDQSQDLDMTCFSIHSNRICIDSNHEALSLDHPSVATSFNPYVALKEGDFSQFVLLDGNRSSNDRPSGSDPFRLFRNQDVGEILIQTPTQIELGEAIQRSARLNASTWEPNTIEVLSPFAVLANLLPLACSPPSPPSLSNHSETLLRRGNDLVDRRYYREALTVYSEALRVDSNNAQIYYGQGYCLAALDRHEEALEAYERALRINSNDVKTLYRRGLSLAALEYYEEALDAFVVSLRINPNNAEIYLDKGIVLAALGFHNEALSSYEDFLERNPDHVRAYEAYDYQGLSLAAIGRHERALEAYSEALRRDPKHVGIHDHQGNSLAALGLYPQALTAYKKALELDPNDAESYIGQANVYERLHRNEEALLAYDHALRIRQDLILRRLNQLDRCRR